MPINLIDKIIIIYRSIALESYGYYIYTIQLTQGYNMYRPIDLECLRKDLHDDLIVIRLQYRH